jgi:hypothetical protein
MLAFSANTKLLADLENAVALGSQLSYAGLDSRLRFSDLRAVHFQTRNIKNSDKGVRFRIG